MPHKEHEESQLCVLQQGLVINGIVAKTLSNRGLGLVASVDHDVGSLLVSVPTECLKTAHTVPQYLHSSLRGISVQGLLAADLILDNSQLRCSWKAILPKKSSFALFFPFWWDPSLQKLLPQAASKLLVKQQTKLESDWSVVSRAFSTITREDYTYYWFTVGTRTFYYDSTSSTNEDPDECLALLPFVDLFNHASDGCEVIFSSEGYKFVAKQEISAGEEIFTSYGEHTNDFLLAEYGFVLDNNAHDSVNLDHVLLDLFDNRQEDFLKTHSFWTEYVLDSNGVCYRTEVALRLLCMPLELWEKCLESGFDEDDNFREAVDEILCKSLKRYSLIAHDTLHEISQIGPHFATQQKMLKRRWEQILSTISNAIAILSERRDRK